MQSSPEPNRPPPTPAVTPFSTAQATAKGQADFKDVSASDWYAQAVAWAVENGVTAGVGGGLFGSGDDCTRAQIVTFLFKAYQGK